MQVANNAQMRQADTIMAQAYAHPTLLLMENAGRGSAEKLLELYPNIRSFLVLCGPGNNGADGLVAARHLHLRGRNVRIVLATEPEGLSAEAALQYAMALRLGLAIEPFIESQKPETDAHLAGGAVIVDAVLGTGLETALRPHIQSLLNLVAGYRNEKVALDMPTGLIGNTGAVLSRPLKCAHTLAFQLPKICHYVTPAALFCGRVHVLDIGIYPEIIEKVNPRTVLIDDGLVRQWHKPRQPDGHKGTYGHVLVAGGSKGLSGAVGMAASGAVEIGAGLCTAFIPGAIACSFHRNTLENMSIPYGTDRTAHLNFTAAEVLGSYVEGKSAVAIGPGLGLNEETRGFLEVMLEKIPEDMPLVLDADALNILAENASLWQFLGPNTILTPHPGEMARLLGAETTHIQNERFESAQQLAREKGVVVVLKGAGTIIASPEGTTYLCNAGNPGMGSGGTGDVLVGAISGLLSQGYPPLVAAALGVYVHARTGDSLEEVYGHEGVTATKIMRNLGRTLRQITKGVAEAE